MGWDCYTVTNPKSRQDYECQACDWIMNAGMSEEDCTPEEWKLIKIAEVEKWRIKKGATYTKCTGKWNGEFTTFRARPEIDEICQKYDIYTD